MSARARSGPALAAVACAAWSSAARAVVPGAADNLSVWRVLASLALCVVIAIVAAVVMRQRLGGAIRLPTRHRGRRLRLVESIRLSGQVDLCIVDCDGAELLMTSSPAGGVIVRELGVRTDPCG